MKLVVYNKTDGYIKQIISAAKEQLECNEEIFVEQGYGCLYVEDGVSDINRVVDSKAVYEPLPVSRDTMLCAVRFQRNELLRSCDWTQIPDTPLTAEQRSLWAAYRQRLRDFPEACDLADPQWPAAPQA